MVSRRLSDSFDTIAQDGSEVPPLAAPVAGGLAHFSLDAGQTSPAWQYETVEELWYFVHGRGQMCVGDDVVDVFTGISVRIPPGTRFQVRSQGPGPLSAVSVAMPPWAGGRAQGLDAPPFWDPDADID